MTATRQRFVETAAALFMQQGYAGSGLKQISTESAAPIGSLYHFFPGGKEELAAETLQWAGKAYQDLVEAVFVASPDIVSGVRNCFEGAAATLESTNYADACPIATVALEVASTNEALRAVTAGIFDEWLGMVAGRLTAAGLTKRDAKELAATLVAALEGGLLLSRAARNTTALRSIGRSMATLVETALAHRRTATT